VRDLCILGIDPGVSGALAFYLPRYPERVSAYDAPVVDGKIDALGFTALLDTYKPDAAVIELVGSRPGQGLSSTFNFGVAFGTACGVVAAAGVPVHFVTPQKWKKHFALDSDKEKSRALALRTWPACAASFARKKDDGRAEAALLARYGADVPFAHMVRNAEAMMGVFG
jgi:crossover junction endodeoxyribonuclease RuvC